MKDRDNDNDKDDVQRVMYVNYLIKEFLYFFIVNNLLEYFLFYIFLMKT